MEEPMGGEEVIQGEAQGSSAQEEKIFVSVRLRPSNEKEISRNDVSDWECINNTTIIFKNSLPERSMFPTAYTFDRVFGCDCATEKVYEEGAKEVALSVVSGINSSIFAYGQTSSGKTYTMSGVTEHAVADIYDYIKRHKERQFVLKFSAMEIYNEAVRDLLSSDSTPLRLLDDPERGTVVEKLTEETLRDWSHLQELLSICDAQRQIGETSLNETSSRSHQILRLTIESSAREYLGAGNSSTLTATVNFVDLAGSERASQTLSAGVRLKEGCHINRSLLTLGTVIRKLSKGKNAHIPYRDSKLTRILQYSLGGNSRTAIICTMSPARSHVEQSRNTLLFASCAKEVTTNAQVNVVMSDKALVKQLQRELARLESEMRSVGSTPASGHSAALLREKELLIEQMDKEIKELTHQRDLAQSRVENLLQSAGEDRVLRLDGYSAVEPSNVDNPLGLAVGLRTCNPCTDYDSPSVLNSNKHDLQLSENPEDNFLLDDSTPKFAGLDLCEGWEEIAQRTDGESEDICKEVRCIEMEETSVNRKIEADELSTGPEEKEGKLSMTGSMNEDAVSSPRKGDKELSLICTSAPEGDKELSHIWTSPQRGDKELSHICTSALEGDKELSHISTSPQKGDKELSHICTSAPEGDKELSHISTSPQKGDKESIPNDTSYTYDALKRKIQEMQKTINYLVSFYPPEQSYCSSEADTSSCRSLNFTRSRSCKASVTNIPSPLWFEKAEQNWNTSPARFEKDFPGRPGGFYQNLSEIKYGANIDNFSRKDSQTSISSMEAQSIKELDVEDTPPAGSEKDFPGRPVGFDQKLSELKYGAHIGNLSRKDSQTSISSMEVQSIKESDVEDITNVCDFVVGLNEMAKLNPEKQSSENLVQEEACKTDEPGKDINGSGLETVQGAMQPHSNWPSEFERQQREIIELWVACKVPLVHRTYFFLLFKGDPSDSVYMEVELRRLSFLKDSFSRGTISMKDSQLVAAASSSKALNREREMLTKQIQKKFSRKEREGLYQKWGIGLNTKQRSVQLARRLWTDTTDMDHIKESAALVAKLVGFVDPGQAPKEIFGLSFLPRSINRRSYSWKS